MGPVWVHADSFLHRVASPFHSFVTAYRGYSAEANWTAASTPFSTHRYVPADAWGVASQTGSGGTNLLAARCELVRTVKLHAASPCWARTVNVSRPGLCMYHVVAQWSFHVDILYNFDPEQKVRRVASSSVTIARSHHSAGVI